MRRALAMIAWLVLGAALLPAEASAGVYQQVLQVYQREGSIPPCAFTGPQLQRALGGVDTYGAQYFADFTQAVQTALTARAGGACVAAVAHPGGGAAGAARPGPGGGPATPADPGTDGGPAAGGRTPVPAPPSFALTAATRSGVPLPLTLLGAAVLAGALVLAGAAVLRRAAGR
jgi:hypothetical protein